jgi:2-polyprenyl-6-methoxyphenol hydroxylase-like FAD-dependent oxidoreductase
MEDGATVAVCLQLAGKGKAQEALRAFEKIRYDRVRAAQKTGESTRDTWHKADFSMLKVNPEKLKLKREGWLLNFDAEEHAYEVYEETVKGMKSGIERRPLL